MKRYITSLHLDRDLVFKFKCMGINMSSLVEILLRHVDDNPKLLKELRKEIEKRR